MHMRKDKALLAVLTVLLLAAAAWMLRQEHVAMRPFELHCTAQGGTERISLWEDEGGALYAFLPSWADAAATTVHLLTDQVVQINGVTLTEDMTCAQWPQDDALQLTIGRKEPCTFRLLQSADLPAMHIDTASGGMAYIHEKKTNEESAQLRLYTPAGDLDHAGKINKIKGRGNNTWEAFDKKPYSLTLSQEADLLGMGAAQEWVLLANAGDPSHMRNRLAFDLAENLGMPWTPQSDWVDVYLNGEYAGVYLLTERIELHPQRVDADVHSTVLLSMEREDRLLQQNIPHMKTAAGQAFRIHGGEKADGIAWQRVEDALLTDNDAWNSMLDLDSWVKMYLINEVLGNGDANYLSQYFIWVQGENERVYAGPVWDFDHAMGQRGAWQRMEPRRFFANQLLAISSHETPWFHAAYQNDAFYTHMVDTYAEQLLPALEKLLNETASTYCMTLEHAAGLDQLRWETEDAFGDEIVYLRDYMTERIAFLNSAWLNGQAHYQVRADQGFGAAYGYYSVPLNGCLTCLPVLPDTDAQVFLGWYDVDTGMPFDETQPINEDQAVVARWQDKPGKKLNTILKLAPAAFFGTVLLLLVAAQALRIRKEG